ncbi:hypothetical protein J6590_045567 [Homalodisca vitripennis]|nr:hypothetical protein J6590_045567 [Homalodisca vitripennis]
MGLGIIMSGVFILRVKPNARFVAAWIAFTAVVYAIGMGILMTIGCPMDDFAGIKIGEGVNLATFESPCKLDCNCNMTKFNPVCGADKLTYYSPCHAGCHNFTLTKDSFIVDQFTDCSCMTSEDQTTERIGVCESQCNNFVWYIILFSMFVFVHSTSEVGSMLLILRCVDPRDKAMALGLIQFAIGLFGNVPCPIVYGAIVDSACLLWDTVCGKQGACRLYDTKMFRLFFHGLPKCARCSTKLLPEPYPWEKMEATSGSEDE